MKMFWKRLGLIAGLVAFHPLAASATSPSSQNVVDEMMKALGAEALAQVRYLRFDFQVDRQGQLSTTRHLWDRQTGQYRVEWTAEKKKIVIWETFKPGFQLSREKVKLDKTMRIRFPILAVLDEVDNSVFDDAHVELPAR